MKYYDCEVSTTFPKHPAYDDYFEVWEKIDDCLDGSSAIKSKTTKYLPKTEGMIMDTVMGDVIYKRYLHGAMFPDLAQDFFIAATGLLKQKDPSPNFPDIMLDEFVPAPAYESEKSFFDIYSEVQDGVMKYSRCGVLLDPPDTTEKKLHKFPLMSIYNTYKILNWGYTKYKGRKVLSWVLLDESYYSVNDDTFARVFVDNYRFLGLKTKDALGNEIDQPLYYTYTGDEHISGVFNPPFPTEEGDVIDEASGVLIKYPNINGKYLNRIPFFCFTGTKMSLEPERPISQSLCEACIYIYNLFADYKEYLYKQGFAIIFAKGMEPDTQIYTGTNKALVTSAVDADLKMVESSGNGLAEYRLAVTNATSYAKGLGLAILKDSGDETGVSVAKRQGFKTASLKSISKTVGDGFTQIAKTAAEWAGLSDDDIANISVVPNVDFSATTISSELTVFQNLIDSDYPIMSDWDIYQNLRSMGKTVYSSFDEYIEEVSATRKARDEYKLSLKVAETKVLNQLEIEQQKAIQQLQADASVQSNRMHTNSTADDSDAKEAKGKDIGDMSKPVMCIETHKTYNSIQNAADDIGVDSSVITKAVHHKDMTAGSKNGKRLHWKFV